MEKKINFKKLNHKIFWFDPPIEDYENFKASPHLVSK